MPPLSTGNADTLLITAAWCSRNYLPYLQWTEFRNCPPRLCKWEGVQDLALYTACISTRNDHHCLEQEVPIALHFYSVQSLPRNIYILQLSVVVNWKYCSSLKLSLKIKICVQINRKTNTMINKEPLMYLYKFNTNFCFKMSISLHLLSWIPPRQMW